MEQKKINKPAAHRKLRSADALWDAILLLQLIGQGEKDFQEGRFLPQEEVFARVRSRLP